MRKRGRVFSKEKEPAMGWRQMKQWKNSKKKNPKKQKTPIWTVSPERRLTVQKEINGERGNRLRKTPADR